MSTKIYYGMRCKKTQLAETLKFFEKISKYEGERYYRNVLLVKKLTPEIIYDILIRLGEHWAQESGYLFHSMFAQIWIPDDGNWVLINTSDNLYHLLYSSCLYGIPISLQEYRYWDNSPAPQYISSKEWKKREQIWTKVLVEKGYNCSCGEMNIKFIQEPDAYYLVEKIFKETNINKSKTRKNE